MLFNELKLNYYLHVISHSESVLLANCTDGAWGASLPTNTNKTVASTFMLMKIKYYVRNGCCLSYAFIFDDPLIMYGIRAFQRAI